MSTKKAVVIIGATASGKSSLALELCRRHNGEIISADSMQVYRRMDIGTAKPSAAELAEIHHHLINIRDFDEPFCAADFICEARAALDDIISRGKLPFVVGGTGLYSEMLFSSSPLPEASPDVTVREELMRKAQSEGREALWQYLYTIDPTAAASVHPNNVKRVVRYIEIFLTTGKTPTEQNAINNAAAPEYDAVVYCLMRPTDETYARIDARVDDMMSLGLLDEVYGLWRDGLENAPTAAQAIGYKEFFPYFKGESDLESCVALVKQHSRNYAKRQKTYFKRMKDVIYTTSEELLK